MYSPEATPAFKIMSKVTRAQTKTFLKSHFQFVYCSFSLNHLELKRQIRLYTPVVPRKSITVCRPQRRKNHTLWGGTYLYGFYNAVPLRGLLCD